MKLQQELEDRVKGWFLGRLPEEWGVTGTEFEIDRDEIIVWLTLAAPDVADTEGDVVRRASEESRIDGFRSDTRRKRIEIARAAEHRFERKVSWGVACGDSRVLFTHLATPAMTRLRMPERMVLDTLIDGGVVRSRSEAIAWCVRLVAKHQGAWLSELDEALTAVREVRNRDPLT